VPGKFMAKVVDVAYPDGNEISLVEDLTNELN
jgi:hypothetical protein